MVNPSHRVYAHGDNNFGCLDRVDYSQSRDEIPQGQVALLYAQFGDGRFHPNFGVIPDDIRHFKENNENVKFFGSMGGRPFALAPKDVPNAVESLERIIREYHLDGIDVCYESIPVGRAALFVPVMVEVIRQLKQKIPDLMVSITVPPPLNDQHYRPLYESVHNLIDYVIYQAHLVADPVATANQLVEEYGVLPYPAGKLFAGCSIKRRHWARVPLPVCREASRVLLNNDRICGTSDWAVICDGDPRA